MPNTTMKSKRKTDAQVGAEVRAGGALSKGGHGAGSPAKSGGKGSRLTDAEVGRRVREGASHSHDNDPKT